MMKNKVGRPKLPYDERAKYQRVAIYPSTYKRMKKLSTERNITMLDLLDDMIEREETRAATATIN